MSEPPKMSEPEVSEPEETSSARSQFFVFRLLGVILGVTAVLALISYVLQVYFIGVN